MFDFAYQTERVDIYDFFFLFPRYKVSHRGGALLVEQRNLVKKKNTPWLDISLYAA